MNTKECKWCCSVDFTLRNTEKVNLGCSKTAFSNVCHKPFTATFQLKVEEDVSDAAKDDAMRLGKLLFAQNEVAVCRAGLLLFQVWDPLWGATFSSVFFKSLQWHQCCFCQETAADETAGLAVASKVTFSHYKRSQKCDWKLFLVEKMVPSVLCESRPFNSSLSHSKSSWSHWNRTPFPQPG